MRRHLAVALLVAGALSCNSDLMNSDVAGSWGGDHALLTLTPLGGTIEYDCASGSVAANWQVTPDGIFTATGGYLAGHGGPIRIDEDTTSRPVRYQGTIRGSTMKLTVTLTDSAKVLGVFDLVRGRNGSVFKCL